MAAIYHEHVRLEPSVTAVPRLLRGRRAVRSPGTGLAVAAAAAPPTRSAGTARSAFEAAHGGFGNVVRASTRRAAPRPDAASADVHQAGRVARRNPGRPFILYGSR